VFIETLPRLRTSTLPACVEFVLGIDPNGQDQILAVLKVRSKADQIVVILENSTPFQIPGTDV
jgi:hypothetical protein